MARVAGVDLPREKRGEVAVTYIYGIGRSTATRILSKANVDPAKKVKAWNDEETARIRELIERELKVEGDLRREISMNVKHLELGALVPQCADRIASGQALTDEEVRAAIAAATASG